MVASLIPASSRSGPERRLRVGLLVLLLLPAPWARADCEGPVSKVADGDTIEVICEAAVLRVRLAQIDAPEFHQTHGRRARNALAAMIDGRRVRLEMHERDSYDRPLATVWLGGLDINREMLRRGHAWVYRGFLRDSSLLDDERHAREQRLGLWSGPDPQPPWKFRGAARGK